MRAMTFERLVRDKQFASRGRDHDRVGALGLDAPTEVVDRRRARQGRRGPRSARRCARPRRRTTARPRCSTGSRSRSSGSRTMSATDVKPDFAVVAPRAVDGADPRSWLDHRRREGLRARPLAHRRRTPAEGLPPGRPRRRVRRGLVAAAGRHGCAPLRRARGAAQRLPAARGARRGPRTTTARRFGCGRRAPARGDDVRATTSARPVRRLRRAPRGDVRPGRVPVLHAVLVLPRRAAASDGPDRPAGRDRHPAASGRHVARARRRRPADGRRPAGVDRRAKVAATRQRRRRSDRAARASTRSGLPGTVNVVLAKSDGAALGVYGIAIQRVTATVAATGSVTVFDDPQCVRDAPGGR